MFGASIRSKGARRRKAPWQGHASASNPRDLDPRFAGFGIRAIGDRLAPQQRLRRCRFLDAPKYVSEMLRKCHNMSCHSKCTNVWLLNVQHCTTVQLCLIIIWNYLAIHHCVMQCECIILQISWLVLDSLQKNETPCFAVAWLFYFSILAQRSTCDFQTYQVWPRDLHGQQGRCYFLNFVSGKVLANGNLQGVVKTWNWMPWDPQMDWSFLRF